MADVDGGAEPDDGAEDETKSDGEWDDGGKRIGPYHVGRLLAEGGFGEVYLARQEKPFPRKVALKILKKGMDTRQVVARFEAEEQALRADGSRVDRQGLRRGGDGRRGARFFAMEYVAGTSITRFLRREHA